MSIESSFFIFYLSNFVGIYSDFEQKKILNFLFKFILFEVFLKQGCQCLLVLCSNACMYILLIWQEEIDLGVCDVDPLSLVTNITP